MREQLRAVDRRLLLGGAGLVGVVLGGVLLMTVFGGGDGADGAALPRQLTSTSVTTTTTTVPRAPAVLAVAAAPALRDPFRQLATVPSSGTAGQGTAQVATVTTQPAATQPAAGAQPAGTTANASLQLVSVVQDASGVTRANITVDGKPFSVAKGEVFSHGYRVEGITGTCVEVSAGTVRAQMCVAGAKP